jgi:hypothetical protein
MQMDDGGKHARPPKPPDDEKPKPHPNGAHP